MLLRLALLIACLQSADGLVSPHGNRLSLEGLRKLLQEAAKSKETIMGSRQDLNLDRTYIDTSLVENAGRGLFAKMECKKGDLLTCYPGDLLVHSTKDYEDRLVEEEDTFSWSPHVPKNHHLEDNDIRSQFSGYILQVTEDTAILGLPSLDQDMAYSGHFANDGARPPQGESQIASYVLQSNELANAMHISLEDFHMVTVATRDIPQGSEILVTYGPEYWMDHASWGSEEEDADWYEGGASVASTGKGFG